jgi:hypothetical protein
MAANQSGTTTYAPNTPATDIAGKQLQTQPGIAALECTPACLTGQLKGRRPGSFLAGWLDAYGASSFINSRAYKLVITSGADSCACMSL